MVKFDRQWERRRRIRSIRRSADARRSAAGEKALWRIDGGAFVVAVVFSLQRSRTHGDRTEASTKSDNGQFVWGLNLKPISIFFTFDKHAASD